MKVYNYITKTTWYFLNNIVLEVRNILKWFLIFLIFLAASPGLFLRVIL